MRKIIRFLKMIIAAAIAIGIVVAADRYVNDWQAAEEARKEAESTDHAGLHEVTVRRVVDGDTLLLTDEEKLRLTGIDAPESVHQDKSRNSVYGELASDHLKQEVQGGDRLWVLSPAGVLLFSLQNSKSDGEIRDRDNYDRLLRLVWAGKPDLTGGLTEEVLRESLNAKMLADGYAVVFFMNEEEMYEDLFYRIQREAENAGRGLWGVDGWKAYAALNYLGN